MDDIGPNQEEQAINVATDWKNWAVRFQGQCGLMVSVGYSSIPHPQILCRPLKVHIIHQHGGRFVSTCSAGIDMKLLSRFR